VGTIVVALFVAGLAFRAPILVVGPLLPSIQSDLGMAHAVAGLLSSIPVLCMAFLAPVGPIVARSIGPRAGVALSIAAAAGFGLLRAVMPTAPLVLLMTIGIGLGMGVVGPILTMVVRTSMPRRAALGTGAYATGYIAGSSFAAAIAVPMAAALGGWRGAFAAIGAASLVFLAAWWLLAPRDAHVRVAPSRPGLPWRRPTGWVIGLGFGLQSVLFYGCVAWLPSIYIERGWSPGDAATLAAFFAGLGIVTTPLVPVLAARIRSRRMLLVASSLLALAGTLGIASGGSGAAPSTVVGAVAAVLVLGLGIGIYFPITLTLPVDVARSPSEAASLAALSLLVGYVLASVGPVLLGTVRDATGDFRAASWLLGGVAVLMLGATLLISERRLRGVPATS
jgi:CP family cyanate transporter-like MFS transporter